MRRALCLLVALAGTAAPQWRPLRDGRTTSGNPSVFAREMLAAHNEMRARVGVPGLAWSTQLAAHAQEWANTLLTRRQFFHRPNSAYGENLFEITGATASAAEVVDDWASESRNYNRRSNTCRGVCGHYTQIVWRQTRELGCAVAGDRKREVWVCNYNPPGNWTSQRPY
jgi:pathogenesis-related protein 1